MRNGDGMFITVGNVRASERKARGVEMIETLRNAFVAQTARASSLNNSHSRSWRLHRGCGRV